MVLSLKLEGMTKRVTGETPKSTNEARSTEGSNVRPKSQNKNWWNLSSTLDDFCPR